MTDQKLQPTGDPNNPWGFNSSPREPAEYKGEEIPVIDETSSRDDLVRYIRILEDRIALTHVFVARPKGAPEDIEELGAVLPHDVAPEKRRKLPMFDLVRVSQNQAERVSILARGYDRVGCSELAQQVSRAAREFDESE
jgi:hypothetical protein